MRVEVRPLDASNIDALAELFRASHSSCFCRYWHFNGNKNEWLERCAFRPEENEAELRASVGSPQGLVALVGEQAVGWLKLTPRAAVPKLRALPVYRSLDLGDEHTTYSIGCLLVHPTFRRQGVARALVDAAPAAAESWGALAVEAYPRRATHPLSDEEAWQGPERVFAAFEVVHEEGPYPVLRRRVSFEG
jgi:GNAT superfamily N-acetyltransferase